MVPVVVNEKLLALNPVIVSPNVTVNCMVPAFDQALPAVMELIVAGGVETTLDGMETSILAAPLLPNKILPE
jgi:hypothetical protein